MRQLPLQQRLLRPHTIQCGAQRTQLAADSTLPSRLLLQPHQRCLHGLHLSGHSLTLGSQRIGARLCLTLCLLRRLQRAAVHRPLLHAGQLHSECLHLRTGRNSGMAVQMQTATKEHLPWQ